MMHLQVQPDALRQCGGPRSSIYKSLSYPSRQRFRRYLPSTSICCLFLVKAILMISQSRKLLHILYDVNHINLRNVLEGSNISIPVYYHTNKRKLNLANAPEEFDVQDLAELGIISGRRAVRHLLLYGKQGYRKSYLDPTNYKYLQSLASVFYVVFLPPFCCRSQLLH